MPVVVAIFFWLESGDFEPVDWFIMLELGIASRLVTWLALALLAVQETGLLGSANPRAVTKLVKSFGYRLPLAALLGSGIVVANGLATLSGVEELHQGVDGWFWMACCWTGQFFWIVFLLRWLGVTRFYARITTTKSVG